MRKLFFLIIIFIFASAFNLAFYGGVSLSALEPSEDSNFREVEGSKEDMVTRVEERKNKFRQQVGVFNISVISEKCESAQVKLGLIRTQSTEISKSQINKYDEVVNRLTEMKRKLSQKNLKSEELDKSVEGLKTIQQSIGISFSDYLLSLDDARNIDCASDPQGFMVSLTGARKSLADIKRLHVEFKVTVDSLTKDTLPSLKDLVLREVVREINS